MRRREFITLIGAATAWPLAARAQQVERSITRPRVAFLGAESASTDEHFSDAFRQGMIEHGILEQRWAEGRSERFPKLVGDGDGEFKKMVYVEQAALMLQMLGSQSDRYR